MKDRLRTRFQRQRRRRLLIAWAASFGLVQRVGVEGTGAFGAALIRALLANGMTVVDVDRTDRKMRRYRGEVGPD